LTYSHQIHVLKFAEVFVTGVVADPSWDCSRLEGRP